MKNAITTRIRNLSGAQVFAGLFVAFALTSILNAMYQVGFFDFGTMFRGVGGGFFHPAAALGITAAFLAVMGVAALGVISGVSYAFGKVRGLRQ